MQPLLRKFAWRLGVRGLVNVTWTIQIIGNKIKIPVIYKGVGLANLYMPEMWMIKLLASLLKKKNGIFIDVGVNVGQTLIKLKCVDPLIEYIGFEPNPVCVWYTKELIKSNNFKNSRIVPVGLFNENSLRVLSSTNSTEVDINATVITNFRPSQRIYDEQYVPVFCFDNIASQFGLKEIAIIKIDVEGAELEVLEGLYKTLATHRPAIIMEMLPIYSDENLVRKNRQAKIEHLIAELGYTILRVRKTPGDGYKGLQRLETIGIHSDMTQCDYVLIPGERLEEILTDRDLASQD